ncbi:MAG: type II toxin-antitoxin system RelE/ParE family toxin [Bacteroidales bacterium]|nr:type II toxin-antitoxin system RelE/ParE family toxin [Bacteroidales bacterium]
MRTVFWNQLAKKDYLDNIDYLLRRWSEKQAQEFIDEVDEIIFILEKGNIEFQETNYENVKRCVLREQITLFYRKISENEIELLRFWNNYKDDQDLSF